MPNKLIAVNRATVHETAPKNVAFPKLCVLGSCFIQFMAR